MEVDKAKDTQLKEGDKGEQVEKKYMRKKVKGEGGKVSGSNDG